jgi:hypothetical protein
MISRYPMVIVTIKSYEEVTAMEEFVFPAIPSKISASQTLLPHLHDKSNASLTMARNFHLNFWNFLALTASQQNQQLLKIHQPLPLLNTSIR